MSRKGKGWNCEMEKAWELGMVILGISKWKCMVGSVGNFKKAKFQGVCFVIYKRERYIDCSSVEK